MQRAEPALPSDGFSPITPPSRLATGPQRQTFSRQQRLLRASEFANVFAQGQRSSDHFFTVLFQPNSVRRPRLGFAISKHKVRLAVGRNRLRRLVRESFRHRSAALPAVDLVFLARDAAGGAACTDLFKSLDKHWRRVITDAAKATGSSHK